MAIEKRAHGRYLVRVYLERRDGRDRYHNEYVQGSLRDARKREREILDERDAGRLVKPAAKSLREFLLEDWLPVRAKDLAEKTVYDYACTIRRHVPEVALGSVTPMSVEKLYLSLAGYSFSLRQSVHKVLSQGLRQAHRWKLIGDNPMLHVNPPRGRGGKRKVRAMEPGQAQAFLDACRGERLEALFVLLLCTGLRPQEALALTWDCLDGAEVRVEKALTFPTGSKWRFSPCKTSGSHRSVTVPASVVQVLREHRQRQLGERLAANRWENHNLVFCTRYGTPLRSANIGKRAFRRVLKRAGLSGFRLYDLRHGCATLLLGQQVSPKIVAERLGHSSVRLTLDVYSSYLPTMQNVAAEALEATGLF